MIALQVYTLANAAQVLNTELSGSDASFRQVSTDTRTLRQGDLFIALKGENFDGHDHLQQAMDNGAVGAVVSKTADLSLPQLEVEDTRIALGQLAGARREAFGGKLVALTGSNGKTTVKELITAILTSAGKVLSTQGNFNNDIGMPLTLLRLENDEQYAVIEMGANHFGEIDYLTRIAKPDVALITNAGAAHLEGFGDIKGVSRAKGEIFSGLRAGGTAIINLDDAYADYWLSITEDFQQITFAIHRNDAEICAQDIQANNSGQVFVLQTPDQQCEITLPLPGLHNAANAVAAAAVAYALDIDIVDIKQALEGFTPVKGRLNFLQGKNGATIIDDTYNANEDSVKAAINVLAQKKGDSIFVFGDLFETGDNSEAIHRSVGSYAREKGIGLLCAVGNLSAISVETFGENARHFNSKRELIDFVSERLTRDVNVLVKGSRGMRMEEIVKELL